MWRLMIPREAHLCNCWSSFALLHGRGTPKYTTLAHILDQLSSIERYRVRRVASLSFLDKEFLPSMPPKSLPVAKSEEYRGFHRNREAWDLFFQDQKEGTQERPAII